MLVLCLRFVFPYLFKIILPQICFFALHLQYYFALDLCLALDLLRHTTTHFCLRFVICLRFVFALHLPSFFALDLFLAFDLLCCTTTHLCLRFVIFHTFAKLCCLRFDFCLTTALSSRVSLFCHKCVFCLRSVVPAPP